MKYVYMLREGDNHYKVGIALNVANRVRSIQTSNATPIRIITMKLVIEADQVERDIHKSLQESKLDGGTEWFMLTAEQALDLAAQINSYPEVDISEKLTLKDLVRQQIILQKAIHKKLSAVIQMAKKPMPAIDNQINNRDIKSKPKRPTLDDDILAAIDIIKRDGRASTSHLQASLSFGFGRATRVMNELERLGKVGAADGAKPRRIYI